MKKTSMYLLDDESGKDKILEQGDTDEDDSVSPSDDFPEYM